MSRQKDYYDSVQSRAAEREANRAKAKAAAARAAEDQGGHNMEDYQSYDDLSRPQSNPATPNHPKPPTAAELKSLYGKDWIPKMLEIIRGMVPREGGKKSRKSRKGRKGRKSRKSRRTKRR